MKNKIRIFVICIFIVYFIGTIGSIFTSSKINSTWYIENKPFLTPPNFVFPIIWTILYFLIALSLYFALINSKEKEKIKISTAFGINLILNALWSYLFFKLQRPLLAFIDLVFIWLAIIIMIFITGKINKKAAWLLIPYLIWVSFAGILNWAFI